MRNESLQKHFKSMGARVKFRSASTHQWRPIWLRNTIVDYRRIRISRFDSSFAIDIKQDKRGEYFDILQDEDGPELELLQVKPKERHLLIYLRPDQRFSPDDYKDSFRFRPRALDSQRFLCGYDERHWFVAGVAEPVSTVREAKASLIPRDIREQVKQLSSEDINKRRNAAFKRQGEWFFIPVNADFPKAMIHKDEPLIRGTGSKPHVCQEIYRKGGELVYIADGKEMTEAEYSTLGRRDRLNARQMMSDPEVYARGYVRHEDHATIKLQGWHRVFINAEQRGRSSNAFLD